MAVKPGSQKAQSSRKKPITDTALPENPAGGVAVLDAAPSKNNKSKPSKRRKSSDSASKGSESGCITNNQQPDSKVAQAEPPQADEAPRKSKRRRGKKKADEPLEDCSPEEKARREHQRERQKLAIRLQATGKPYKRQKRRKPDESGQKLPKASYEAAKSATEAPESGSKPDHCVQVIVVPIFWNKRVQEKEAVLAAAEQITSLLCDVGIDAGCDTTTALSPGQKFRTWEMQGVKLRVEVGPKEAEQGTCIFSVCSKPGEVAAKTPMKVGQQLLDSVRKQLPDLPPADAAQDSAALARLKAPPAQGNAMGQPVRQAGRTASVMPAGKHTHFGGDDLDDDFAAEAQEEEQTKKKQKARGGQNALVAHVPQAGVIRKPKTSKVVQF